MRTTAQLTEAFEEATAAPIARLKPTPATHPAALDAKPENSLYEQILEAARQQATDKLKAILEKTCIDLYDAQSERTPVAQLAFEKDRPSVYFLIRHGASRSEAAYGFAWGGHEREAFTMLDNIRQEINYFLEKLPSPPRSTDDKMKISSFCLLASSITIKMAEGFARACRPDLCEKALIYLDFVLTAPSRFEAARLMAYGFVMAQHEELANALLEKNPDSLLYQLEVKEGILHAKARQNNLNQPLAYAATLRDDDYVFAPFIYEYALGGHYHSALLFAEKLAIYTTPGEKARVLKTICAGLAKRSINAEMRQFIKDQPEDQACVKAFMAHELVKQGQMDKAHEWLAEISLNADALQQNIPLEGEVLAITHTLRHSSKHLAIMQSTYSSTLLAIMQSTYSSTLFVKAIQHLFRFMLSESAGEKNIFNTLVMIENNELRAQATTAVGRTPEEIICVQDAAMKTEKFRAFMQREHLTYQQALAWDDTNLLSAIFMTIALVARNKISADVFFACLSYLTPMKKSELTAFADRFSRRFLPLRPQVIQWGLSMHKENKTEVPQQASTDIASSSLKLTCGGLVK